MKLKTIIMTLIFALMAIPSFAATLCSFDGTVNYYTWGSALASEYGDNIEFIKFCWEETNKNKNTDPYAYNIYIGQDRATFTENYRSLPAIAARYNRWEAVKFFVEKGYSADYVDCYENALQLTAYKGHYATTKYLLDKGANPLKKSGADSHIIANADAYAFAKKGNNSSVIELVRTAWSAKQKVAEARREEYRKEIQSINMNDYEQFKLKHNLGRFNTSSFWGVGRA